MRYKINRNNIFTFLFLTLFLDAYCFFSIGNRDITLWYVGTLFLFILSFKNIGKICKGLNKNPYPFLMIIYMIINYFMYGKKEIFSLMIGIYCWLFFGLSYRECTVYQFEKTVIFFQRGMNFFAVYGIYQVIAYYMNLPFKNLWLDGVMVDGYNWGNNIRVGNIILRRANAIFREPSFFSQFLAINILIYFVKLIYEKNNTKKDRNTYIKWCFINCIALICSFSGTGLIILVVGGLLVVLNNDVKKIFGFFRRHSILTIMVFIFLCSIFVIPNPVKDYMFSRISEFNSSNTKSISGYLRMVLPYQAAIEILRDNNILFGIGIGNAFNYSLTSIGRTLGNAMQPIVARTLSEEGIIGGLLLGGSTIKTWRNRNLISISYQAIFIGACMMSFMHGTWSSEVFWLFWGFLNVKIIE